MFDDCQKFTVSKTIRFLTKKFETNHFQSYIIGRETGNPCLEFILIDLTQYVSTNKSYISIYEIHNYMITIFKL